MKKSFLILLLSLSFFSPVDTGRYASGESGTGLGPYRLVRLLHGTLATVLKIRCQ